MQTIIRQALAAYETGYHARALRLIESLLSDTADEPVADTPEATAAQIHRRMESPTVVVYDWLHLARDRLRGVGIVPVPMALNTALTVLGADQEGQP